MKKNYFIAAIISLLSFANSLNAQHFHEIAQTPTNDGYNYMSDNADTMYFTFPTLPTTAYSDASLNISGKLEYFFPGTYYTILAPGLDSIGFYGQEYYCGDISVDITIPLATLSGYGPSAVFKLVRVGAPSPCSTSPIRMTMDYDWCATGVPVSFP